MKMTLEEYLKNKSGQSKNKFIKSLTLKIILSIFILFSILSIIKLSPDTKNAIKKELFETNFNFSIVNNFISKIFPKVDNVSVNDEGIKYKKQSNYLDGVMIEMDEGESVNLIDSGIVVFIGEKEGYGKTIIIQQSNGIDVWYGNVDNININLYDYVNKNTVIATSKDRLYLVFQKNGEFLDYKSYI